jgi:hypothetical protein
MAMDNIEIELKETITERYGSIKKFCEKVGMPWTTLDSILKRGIGNANITNVLKITHELGIDAESLASGVIRPASPLEQQPDVVIQFDSTEFTAEELNRIKEFAAFLKSSRKDDEKGERLA